MFAGYSGGVKTQRDPWCYNASKEAVAANMSRMIDFYNSELERFVGAFSTENKKAREAVVDGFVNRDSTKISWTAALKQPLVDGQRLAFQDECLTVGEYAPSPGESVITR